VVAAALALPGVVQWSAGNTRDAGFRGAAIRPASYAAGEILARKIVDRAILAHGGRQAWLRKKDASFDTTWTHYRAGRPALVSRYVVKFPIASGPVPAIVETEENGKPVLMGASGSRSWFLVGQERHDDVESLKTNRAFVQRAQRLLALPFRLDDPSCSLAYDGEQVRSGVLVDRVKALNGLEPPGLYLFERETGRLVGMGSEVADPPTSMESDLYDFDEVDGILIPRTQVFDRVDPVTGGRSRALTVSVDRVRFDNGFPPETFEPPPVR
jgi:hypothetical protein